jgi:SAM-dependent methyltransferase
LDIAEQRLPSAEKLLGSICALPEHYSDQFDRAFASHVIYHIEANQQSKAVRELIRACKPGGRIVILYSNPASPIRFAAGAVHRLRKIIVPERRFRRPDYTSLRTHSAGGSSSKMTATSP